MNKRYDIDTIISVEDFKRNQKKHLKKDAKKRREQKKEKIMNIAGVVMFYSMIVIGVFLINARFEQIDDQTKSATEPVTHIAQK